MFSWKSAARLTLVLSLLAGAVTPGAASAAEDRTSKYRVYQKDQTLKEFSDRNQAIGYAKAFDYSYVEAIDNRGVIWDNMPKFKVYQKDFSKPEWEFATLKEAVSEAKKWGNASVRELSSGGWVWDNYDRNPGFDLYQGEKTLPQWHFATLDKAKAEAKKWGNAHIIDRSNNRWVWDNIPAEQKQDIRQNGAKRYRVYQGANTKDDWTFALLQDAVNESLKWADSYIVNTERNDAVVFRNELRYVVYQGDQKKSSFAALPSALNYAGKLENARILWDGRAIWTNAPYYRVERDGAMLKEFHSFRQAAAYGRYAKNSYIVTLDGMRLWDNLRELIYLGWNGSVKASAISGQVSQTQGLDIDSPSWFSLADATGKLKDDSDPAALQWLKSQGIEVHPLVDNQFNSKLTTAFLSDEAAQKRFIDALVGRSVELGVEGINIDFESMAASDRDKFTAFVAALAKAAHAQGLTVSIDLLRGSVLWNHKTAYDHAKLHEHVDYVIIMAYDQFWKGSESPGPVAGLDWVEGGIEEYLSYGIPRSKMMLGIPFYIRVWELDAAGKLVSNQAVFMKDIQSFLADGTYTAAMDQQYGLMKFDLKKNGKRYVFWMEDIETIGKRIDLAKKYDLAGVAAWRLGYEPAELWTEMLRAK
ncbi:glycosyl hydrolase family 18 protein [Paenibacillus thermotolerans]|uniref:glycosyl hydrolase family 18 protein n=1 Tax=Paenibacillus thermotolerans TaxID=3027807 RepID=UPI0023675228|nr:MULTISPECIES: glycosyl hydrolase family 18 protein [unclassified Paenibacillus]